MMSPKVEIVAKLPEEMKLKLSLYLYDFNKVYALSCFCYRIGYRIHSHAPFSLNECPLSK